MPQSTPELREEWQDDHQAMVFLEKQGYIHGPQTGRIRKPAGHHQTTEEEYRAIVYLVREWDFTFERDPMNNQPK